MERTTVAPTRTIRIAGERPARRRTAFGAVREFLAQSPLNVIGVVLIGIFLFLVVFGSALAPHDPVQPNIVVKLQPPSSTYWFGTDELGRDVLSRVMSGAKYSLGVAFIILSIAVVVGTVVGLIAGYVGGLVDELLMRLTDLFLAFPALVLAMAIAATLGRNLQNTVIALTAVYWPWYARLVRGQVLWLKEREFVEAARAIGATPLRILWRHILPNTLAVIIVQVTLDIGYAVLATSGLSFRPRRPAADPGMGYHDRWCSHVLPRSLVVHHVPWARAHLDGAGLQPARRRTA